MICAFHPCYRAGYRYSDQSRPELLPNVWREIVPCVRGDSRGGGGGQTDLQRGRGLLQG